MKTVSISRGDENVVSITIHDQELNITVHDAVAEDVKELPVRMLYKGQRVRNLREIHHVKKGATGTVDEDHDIPYVIWDSPEMLTDAGRRRENRRWVQDSGFLEVIEEVKELPYLTNSSDTNPDEPVEVKIPFDTSRMAEAVRFETRDGREVKCVVANDVEAEYPVTGYLNGGMLTWTNDGRFSTTGAQRPLDLFMVVKEVKVEPKPNPKPEITEQPWRIIPKDTRVMNLVSNDYVLKGASGTTVTTSSVPCVKWDSDDMLTKLGKIGNNRIWPKASQHLMDIEEVKP